MDFPPYSLQADQTQKVIVTSIISQILEEVEIMSKFIFPLQMSATDGKYHNYFGEFSEESFDAIKRALLSENSTSKKVECK